jgi:ATP-binding cassette, subfamily C (CFTR/MRP), member 1
MAGAITIRSYAVQKFFIKRMQYYLDENLVHFYTSRLTNRWIALRLELIGNLITLFAALFIIVSRNEINEGLASLSISYSLGVSGTLNWLIRTSTELEASLTSIESINEYCDNPQEVNTIEKKNSMNYEFSYQRSK